MDKVTKRQSAVLDVLDEQIAELEAKLVKVQPYINELNRLKQTRRVLLSEKGTTGGGGNAARTLLSQEETITFLRDNGPARPAEIASALGVDSTVVRSHLSRHKDTTYERMGDGTWGYIGSNGDDELDEEDEE